MTTDIMQPTEEGLKVVHLPMGEPLTAHEGAKINRIHSKQEPLQDGSFYFCFEPSKLILHKQKGHFSLFPGEVPNMGKYQYCECWSVQGFIQEKPYPLFSPLPSICELTMTGVHIHVEQLSREGWKLTVKNLGGVGGWGGGASLVTVES